MMLQILNMRVHSALSGLREFWLSGNIIAAFVLLSYISTPFAAPLTITSETVSVTRADASNPLELSLDSISVLGAGDTVRTGPRGRALVDLGGGNLVLIMPESQISITHFEHDGGIARLSIGLTGHVIARISQDDNAALTVDAGFLRISPHGLASLWTHYEGGDVITVHSGTADYIAHQGSETGTVVAGEGFYADGVTTHRASLREDAPYPHAAQLIGNWRGCPGTIVNTGSDALNLRVGPGLAASVIGYSEAGAAVKVIGVNETRSWYRVQRFSGFGWMRGFYLAFECSDFQVYPNTQVEQNLELRAVQAIEYDLIQPFYGTPESNPWVYRTFRASQYEGG